MTHGDVSDSQVKPDQPIRPNVAVALAFSHGSMTASSKMRGRSV